MALGTSPGQRFEVWLKDDEKKLKKNRRIFIMQYLSCNDWQELAKMHNEFYTLSDDGSLKKAWEIIGKCLVGWANIGVKFDGEKMAEIVGNVISMPQVTELMLLAITQSPTENDRKKSGSPSGSGTAGSARDAGAKSSAKTHRRNRNPS